MSRSRKWIYAGLVLLGLGALLCGTSFAIFGFHPESLSTWKMVSNTYPVRDSFQNIKIDADTDTITLLPSKNGICRVVCVEEEEEPHRVTVQNNTLIVDQVRLNKMQFGFNFQTEKSSVTLYLPEKTYRELQIKCDTGDVEIPEDFFFDSIRVDMDTGDVECLASAEGTISLETDTGAITVSRVTAAMRLQSNTGRIEISDVAVSGDLELLESTGRAAAENVTCRNLYSDGDTGGLILTNVLVSGEMRLEQNTGDIKLNGCDAGTIFIETDTGDVRGTLLSDKIFLTKTDSGEVDVPRTITGGRCEITTDTGDIKIEVRP